jgi:hypothetical protein
MKIGYAILAHDHPLNVARLAQRLIEADGIVSLHLDRKGGPGPVEAVRSALGAAADRVVWPERVSVGWGEWSMIEASLNAVRAIFAAGHQPDYVHLMSGADYPIRPIADFKAFLGRHAGTDFIESYSLNDRQWVRDGLTRERYEYRHFFNYKRHPKLFEWNWRLQRALGLRRSLPGGMTAHFGSQWCTLTARSWKTILDMAQRADIVRAFKMSWIPDEMFCQTLLSGSFAPSSNRHLTLYEFSDYGVPIVYCNGHFEHLREQPFFFARKISPFAARLRDELDRAVRGEAGLPSFPDSQIGKPTQSYERFRKRNRHGEPGRRIPGFSKDPWYGDLEWNRKPYVVFMGTSSEELHFIAGELDKVPGIAGHGRLFAADEIHFAGNRSRYAGYGCREIGLRDHKQPNFLADVIHAAPSDLCTFALDWNDDPYITDVVRFDKRARIILVKGSVLRAFAEDEKALGAPGERPLDVVKLRRPFLSFQARQSEFYEKNAEQLEKADAKFIEIDLYGMEWRRQIADFLSPLLTDSESGARSGLDSFANADPMPLLGEMAASFSNIFEWTELVPPGVSRDRQIAPLLARIGRPYLVLVGGSREETEAVAGALNRTGKFEIHGPLFSPDAIEFAEKRNEYGGYARTDAARRDASPADFLAAVCGKTDKIASGFVIDGLHQHKIFDYILHDPNARILAIRGDALRALAENGNRASGHRAVADGWYDPRKFDADFAYLERRFAILRSAMAQASAVASIVDLRSADWIDETCDFLQSLAPEIDESIARQLRRDIAAHISRVTLSDPLSCYTNARFLKARIGRRDQDDRIARIVAGPDSDIEMPAGPKRQARLHGRNKNGTRRGEDA